MGGILMHDHQTAEKTDDVYSEMHLYDDTLISRNSPKGGVLLSKRCVIVLSVIATMVAISFMAVCVFFIFQNRDALRQLTDEIKSLKEKNGNGAHAVVVSQCPLPDDSVYGFTGESYINFTLSELPIGYLNKHYLKINKFNLELNIKTSTADGMIFYFPTHPDADPNDYFRNDFLALYMEDSSVKHAMQNNRNMEPVVASSPISIDGCQWHNIQAKREIGRVEVCVDGNCTFQNFNAVNPNTEVNTEFYMGGIPHGGFVEVNALQYLNMTLGFVGHVTNITLNGNPVYVSTAMMNNVIY